MRLLRSSLCKFTLFVDEQRRARYSERRQPLGAKQLEELENFRQA